jgi:NTE family protein
MTGVLAGLEDGSRLSLAACDYFVGTSAGSVVAKRLVAGERLQRPVSAQAAADRSRVMRERNGFPNWALGLGGPAASIGIRLASPPTAMLRATALRCAPQPSRQVDPLPTQPLTTQSRKSQDRPGVAHDDDDRPSGEWDGRLRVVAVERNSGRRVVFGSPGAPRASVDQAVRASCAVPWVFSPVSIAGSEYVDGAVWSPTNLDVAPAQRGARVLCLAPTASLHGPRPLATRATSRAATLVEAAVISGRGAYVQIVAPDRESATLIGRSPIAQEPAAKILAAGYQQGLAL